MNKLQDLFDAVGISLELSTEKEMADGLAIINEVQNFTSGMRDCIKVCFKEGPVFDGDIPSAEDRNNLMKKGYITKVVMRTIDGYNGCTQKGALAYKLISVFEQEERSLKTSRQYAEFLLASKEVINLAYADLAKDLPDSKYNLLLDLLLRVKSAIETGDMEKMGLAINAYKIAINGTDRHPV